LANAPQNEVLRFWQGLGYYSRARNLHQTAQYIADERHGVFPASYSELLKLKGIGTYTAAAIASFAFDEAVAVLDGNVYRVLSRVFGIETDITSTKGKKQFMSLAASLIPKEQPATFNQAIMEFGAIQCTPSSPDCLLCPFQVECQANALGKVAVLPVKSKKIKMRERFFNYFIFVQNQKIAMRLRTAHDVWQQLYDFHLIETNEAIQSIEDLPEQNLLKEWLPLLAITPPTRTYTHVLTHQRIQAQFWILRFKDANNVLLTNDLQFYSAEEIEKLPKPILIADYWKAAFFE